MKNRMTDSEEGMNLFLADKHNISLLAHRKIAEASGLFRTIRSAVDGLHVFDLVNEAAEGSIPFPDVIMFDLDLPVLNGITLLKVLQKSDIKGKEKISLVVLAASVSTREKEIARSLGVSVFLTKPLSDESLHAAMATLYPGKVEVQMSDLGV